MNKTFDDFYMCHGHYHRKVDGLMANPFNNQVMPDQWCNNIVPDPDYIKIKVNSIYGKANQSREVTKVAAAQWCKIGKHAYDPDDEGAEEFTRTVKVKDRYGEMRETTKAFSVCSEHLNAPLETKVLESNAQSVPEA